MELTEYYIAQLRENPGSNSFSEDEGFPKGCYDSELKFRKIKFKTPELDGAAGVGRLMYVLCEEKCTVYLVWVYTHDEFDKRPPEDDLRSEFAIIQENIENIEES